MTFRSALVPFLFLVASCAEGGGATLPILPADGGSSGATTCGNGVIDNDTEACECPVGSTGPCVVQGMDCATMDPSRTGALLCDQAMCMILDDMCMSAGTAGSGGSGTGG